MVALMVPNHHGSRASPYLPRRACCSSTPVCQRRYALAVVGISAPSKVHERIKSRGEVYSKRREEESYGLGSRSGNHRWGPGDVCSELPKSGG